MRGVDEGGSRLPLGIVAAVVIAAFVALNSQLPSIDIEEALQDVGSSLGDWTYALVGLAAFLETGAFVGLVLPGETTVILGGAVAGQGETTLVVTIAVVWFSAWAGDSVSFMIGRRLGRGFLIQHGPRMRITPERLASVDAYFARHGGKTIVIGRFIGIVRAVAPFIAGSSGMPYRAFVPYSILGTGLWAATFTLIGYFASQSLDEAAEIAGRGTLVFGIVVGAIVGIVIATRYLRVAENRRRLVAAMERTAPLRPVVALARRLRAPARFVAGRFTPGRLGLQFTALLSALVVGLYVLIAYAVVVADAPGATAGDMTAFDVADRLRTGWLTDITKVVSELGSAAVALPVTVLCALLLAARRRWFELGVLLAATVIAYGAVPELKDAIDRPRPPDPLVGSDGSSFPSGHAAHAVLYPWLALTLAIRLRPGMAGASALIGAGIALAVLIGLSRVYLRVHYLSDVSGGLGLGVAAFAGCAAAGLALTFLRKNASADASVARRARAAPGEDRK